MLSRIGATGFVGISREPLTVQLVFTSVMVKSYCPSIKSTAVNTAGSPAGNTGAPRVPLGSAVKLMVHAVQIGKGGTASVRLRSGSIKKVPSGPPAQEVLAVTP